MSRERFPCPDTGQACEAGCNYPHAACSRIRTGLRCPHNRHPGECGQCLAKSSELTSLFMIPPHVASTRFVVESGGDLPPGTYNCVLGEPHPITGIIPLRILRPSAPPDQPELIT